MKTKSVHTVAVEVDATDIVVLSPAQFWSGDGNPTVRFQASSEDSIIDAEAKMNDFIDRILAARESA